MKKLPRVLSLLSVALIFVACKKDTKETIDEVSVLFKNTEWTGEVKYSNKPVVEPFAVEFFENGTFKWHEYSGDFDGTYTINAQDREIKLHFTLSNGMVTATVTQDNKFSNISSPNVLSCELNSCGTLKLDNTNWTGEYNTGNPIYLNFKTGRVVETAVAVGLYERTGTTLRFEGVINIFFSVIQPDSITIRGVVGVRNATFPYYRFDLTKQ